MNLIQLCLRRPVGVSVGVLLVVLFGLLALFWMPVQLTPNVDTPIVTVTTMWLGATPQEVEREIVDRQEEKLQFVEGLRKMTSESRDNRAQIKLEFYPGIDKDAALRDVNDKLRQVSGYPLEVDEPTVAAANAAADSPIAWLILYPPENDEGEQVRKLADFARDYIKPYVERVPGVASVDVYGGMDREMQVRLDAGALASRQITFAQVIRALRSQNVNISAGTRTEGKLDYTVRTVGQYRDAEQIRRTVVTYTGDGPVYVGDIARVVLDYKKPISFVRSKGRYVLAFPVRREVGTNVLEVMAGVRAAVARVNEEVLNARKMRLHLEQVYDETVYIDQSIAMVQQNIIYGGALAVIVLLLFLRNVRATLVVALAIPISVIGTFMVVALLGRTLNVISLAGIAFAVGMVVDNAIVVLENIYRHYQLGKTVQQAAFDGAREVWGAVLASTLTTLAVFLPVVFVREEAGQLFRDISIATSAAVALSLIVAVTVIPTLSARLLAARRGGQRSTAPADTRHVTGRLPALVSGLVDRANRSTLGRAIVILGMLAAVVLLTPRLVPATTYLPAGNRNLVFGFLLTPPGYSLDEFNRMGHIIEATLRPYWEVQPGTPEKRKLDQRWVQQVHAMIDAGAIPELRPDANSKLSALERDRLRREWLTPPPLIDNFFFVSFNGGCFMGCTSRDPQRVKPLKRLMETAGGQIPGVYPIFFQTQLFSFGGGNTAEVQIRGDDLEKVTQAAIAMYQETNKRFGRPQPNPANFNLGRPELRIISDRERAADLGMTVADVGTIVEACVDGAYVDDFREQGGRTIDLSLYVQGQHGKTTRAVGQVPIFTPSGRVVPLKALVRMLDTTSPEQINHVERQRAVTLTVHPPESVALASVIGQIRNEIVPALQRAHRIDPSILVSLTGNADKLEKARTAMVGKWEGFNWRSLRNFASSRFFLSILIVYLLIVALYESWLYPLVIMFSVPLAVLGGFLGLSIAHWGTLLTTDQPVQQLDVLTFLGFVILVGIVVNNAILLVDQALQNLRLHGMSRQEAVREAVRVRVRPVLMTSLTTFFGQLPLALFPGAGSELYRGLAAVMLGGMLVATLGTLVLVPTALGVVLDLRAALARLYAGRSATPTPSKP